jgi:ADP-ribosylation factor related protein 1
MYHLITGLYAEWTKKPRYNALMVGAAGVGKSCLLEKVSTVATLRFQLLPLTPFPPLLDQERLSQETGTAAKSSRSNRRTEW